MIRNLTVLYAAINDNKIVVFDTNLKSFWEKLRGAEPECRNYDYYSREFKKKSTVIYISPQDRIYILQRIEP